MAEHDKADEARKGLFDSVKGKAKEIAGAVIGNDSLTAEGQLEQTQAQERKEANSIQAVADAEAEVARAEAADALRKGAHERAEVSATTAALEEVVDVQRTAKTLNAAEAAQRDAAAATARAEQDAQREVERAKAQERVDVKAATAEVVEAVDEHRSAAEEAADARAEADLNRQRADNLTNQADLP